MRQAQLYRRKPLLGARARLRLLFAFGLLARGDPITLRLDQLAGLFSAISQIEGGGQLGIEALALLEMTQRLRELALLLQILRLGEVLTRRRALFASGGFCSGRGQERHDQ
jgi:hypothetical protein